MKKFRKQFMRSLILIALLVVATSAIILNLQKNKALPLKKINTEFIDKRMALMRDWFLANTKENNTLPYFYNPINNTIQKNNNIIRQLLATQGIFALAENLGDAELRKVGEKNLAAIFRKYYKFEAETGFGFFEGDVTIKLGGAALGIVTILEGEISSEYAEELEALSKFVEAMQQPDGSFQTFYQPPNFENNERFYSGEALLAAARLAEFTGEQKWLDFVEQSFEYYQAKITKNFFPQFVPWHTMAYAEAWWETNDAKYVDFIFWMNDRLIDEMLETETEDLRTLGRFYNSAKSEYGPPHSSSTAIYLEGITYAYEVALAEKDDARVEKYREAILLGARSLLELQFTTKNSAEFENPEKLLGSIRRAIDRPEIRIDQIGHAANALVRVKNVLED